MSLMSSTNLTKQVVECKTVLQSIWSGFVNMSSNKIARVAPKIGTHNGKFHCDEVLACFMLMKLPQYKDAQIVRTRTKGVLDECDIVVDVGGVYDPQRRLFDHHQRGFAESLSTVRPDLADNRLIKLSSAGLIYAHYGLEVIEAILRENDITLGTAALPSIYLNVYDNFVQEVDAIDNGIPMCEPEMQKYTVNTHIEARVSNLNIPWNIQDADRTPEMEYNHFLKAMNMVGDEFKNNVISAATLWWPARLIVRKALENRLEVHDSGQIIMLDRFCPWASHLYTLENDLNLKENIKFIIFPDDAHSWRVRAVPVQNGSFVCRVFLHQKWRGLRDDQLQKISNIESATFCHASGFIGGSLTKEGAIKMALFSIQAPATDRD